MEPFNGSFDETCYTCDKDENPDTRIVMIVLIIRIMMSIVMTTVL